MAFLPSRYAAFALFSMLLVSTICDVDCLCSVVGEVQTSRSHEHRRSLTQQISEVVVPTDLIKSDYAEPCDDHPPPHSDYSCYEQKGLGKCFADFIKEGDFCRRTCGRCDDVCNDVKPPSQFDCADQKKHGKCEEPYIRDWGFCALTCGKCSMKRAAAAAADITYSGGASSAYVPDVADGFEAPGTSYAQSQVEETASAAAAAAEEAAEETAADKGSAADARATPPAPLGEVGLAGQIAAGSKHLAYADSEHSSDDDDGDDGIAKHAGHHAAATHSNHDDGDDNDQHQHHHPTKKHGDDDGKAVKARQDDSSKHVPVTHVHKKMKKKKGHSKYVIIHSGLMAAAFGVIIPAGVFSSRYGKNWGHWFNVHRAVQVVGYLIATAGFFLGLALHKLKHMERARLARQGRRLLHDQHSGRRHSAAWLKRHQVFLAHKYLGIAIFLVLTLQIAAAIVQRPRKGSRMRATWSWSHWLAGWLSLAAGLANCGTGVHLLRPLPSWWIVLTAAVMATIVGVVAVIEVRHCIYSHRLEGYKQANENGGLELVGGSREERQGLTNDDPYGKHMVNGDSSSMDSGNASSEEELTMVTSKYAA